MAKILLADDSTHAQRMGTKILAAEGHEVTTVSNGKAAIKIMDEVAPDLIVADIFMPGKNGYELCQWVKSSPKWKHIPVLLTIGAMEPYDPVEGRKAHADGLVTKPLESSDLVATIQKLLATTKKPAPPAPVKKPAEEPAPAEALPEEEVAQEVVAPEPEEFELPEGTAQQPVALFGDLLESPGPAEGQESASLESSPLEFPGAKEVLTPESDETSFLAANLAAVEPETATEEEQQPLAQSFLADMSAAETRETEALEATPVEEAQTVVPSWPKPQAEDEMVWTAEPAPVTEQDEKLFAPASDWGSLTKMAEGESKEQPATTAGAETERLKASAESPSLASPLESGERTIPGEAATSASLVSTPSQLSEGGEPTIAPMDRLTLEQLVRESVEEMLPQIVDRIAQALRISLPKKPSDS
ncbi:MAG: response regulator [Acidobacteria bacterium]|nr:response regulator [Acidobacteriota bacterium]